MSSVVLILVLPKVRYSSGFFQNVLFSFAFLQLECVWLNIVFIWISNLLIILWTSWTLCLSLILEIHWPLSFQIFFQLHSLDSPSLFHFWIHYNFYSYPMVIGYSLPLFFPLCNSTWQVCIFLSSSSLILFWLCWMYQCTH